MSIYQRHAVVIMPESFLFLSIFYYERCWY